MPAVLVVGERGFGEVDLVIDRQVAEPGRVCRSGFLAHRSPPRR
jgi:hypothetical protein